MSHKPSKIQRLIRLNEFQEERADDALRFAVKEQAQIRKECESAATDIDRIGKWKAPGRPDAAIDLTVYGAALELEQRAMARADSLQKTLTERERSTQLARTALDHAVSASRVSNKRGKREFLCAESEQEKRTFDQISDVWLNNREPRRD